MGKRAQGKYAYGFCDRTGFRYPLEDLVEEYVQGEPTGLRVGRDVADDDHPQNWLGTLDHYDDPQALANPRPDRAQDDSRKMFSWDPIGVGNMIMQAKCGRPDLKAGRVTVNTDGLIPDILAVGVLHDQFSATDDLNFLQLSDGATFGSAGQAWQSGSSPSVVTGVSFRVRIGSSPTGTFKASIYAHTGTYGTSGQPTGSPLVSSASYSVSVLPTAFRTVFLPMSEAWEPDADTNYFAILDCVDVSGDSSNSVRVVFEPGGVDATHSGNSASWNNSGNWQSSTQDVQFKVYYAS